MQKENIAQPLQPQEEQHLYTEGIDYAQTGNDSIWGTEDRLTLDALIQSDIHGRWLNLCSGDGRFNATLLQRADTVVACDADQGALNKLLQLTKYDFKPKLKLVTCNIVEPLPFDDTSFEGIFCTGTLHLFPRLIFKKILHELDRMLRKDGLIIIDFATDIKRVRSNGSLYTVKGEPLYTIDEALNFLKECFVAYETVVQTASVEPEEVHVRGETYLFSSNFILIQARKK